MPFFQRNVLWQKVIELRVKKFKKDLDIRDNRTVD